MDLPPPPPEHIFQHIYARGQNIIIINIRLNLIACKHH